VSAKRIWPSVSRSPQRRADGASTTARWPAGRLHARQKALTHPALLVVDEIGYLPISRTGAMLFFQFMTRRYEHASTVLTSNKGSEDWGDIFG
jgi:DNA replication protein DnaC